MTIRGRQITALPVQVADGTEVVAGITAGGAPVQMTTQSIADLAGGGGGTTPVSEGGTGLTSYAAGDLIYATGTTVLARLAMAGAEGYIVTRDGAGLPSWQAPRVVTDTKTADYTTALTDGGRLLRHPASDNFTRVFTINNMLVYPVGSTISFLNLAAAAQTISLSSGTLYLLPAGTTGSRTLAQYGYATAQKTATDEWIIMGNSGLT